MCAQRWAGFHGPLKAHGTCKDLDVVKSFLSSICIFWINNETRIQISESRISYFNVVVYVCVCACV